jgi:hypothetical protein
VKRLDFIVPAAAVFLIVAGLTVGISSLGRTRDQAQAATVQAIQPFQRLMTSTALGTSRSDFRGLLWQAQAAYDGYRPATTRDLKVAEALAAALRHYHSALTWWDISVRYHEHHQLDVVNEWGQAEEDVHDALAALQT